MNTVTTQQWEWEQNVMAFLRNIANYCNNCMRRGERCAECEVRRAKSLVEQKNNLQNTRRFIDRMKDPHSLKARYREIVSVLRKADAPLRTQDIILRTTMSRNVKWWTLNRMASKGILVKTRIRNLYGRYQAAFYVKNRKRRENENHTAGNHKPETAQGRQACADRQGPHGHRRQERTGQDISP